MLRWRRSHVGAGLVAALLGVLLSLAPFAGAASRRWPTTTHAVTVQDTPSPSTCS